MGDVLLQLALNILQVVQIFFQILKKKFIIN